MDFEEEVPILKQEGPPSIKTLTSVTDKFPKTNFHLTTVTVIKSYIGLGILSCPYGFRITGYALAISIMLLNAMFSAYTGFLQIKCKEVKGDRIKTYTELANACYGHPGQVFMALLMILGQVMACISYSIFFYDQMGMIYANATGYSKDEIKFFLYIFSSILAVLLSFFESMEELGYLSIVCLVSLLTALIYVICSSTALLFDRPSFDQDLVIADPRSIPSFFGIALFAFEGNPLILEIYYQAHDRHKNFIDSLNIGLLTSVSLVVVTGVLSYASYAQYTESVVLLNLEPTTAALIVQVFYSFGLLASMAVVLVPAYKAMRLVPGYSLLPDSSSRPNLKFQLLRALTNFSVTTIGYLIPNLASFINLQGAVVGTFVTFVCPIAFFFKCFGGQVGLGERVICWGILAYGVVGGSLATYDAAVNLF